MDSDYACPPQVLSARCSRSINFEPPSLRNACPFFKNSSTTGWRFSFPAICLLAILNLTCVKGATAQAPGQGPTRVVAGLVVKSKRAASQSFVGTLEATRKAIVGSAVGGRVTTVKVDAGDPIGGTKTKDGKFEGQPLVELRTETLDIEIRAAELQHQLTIQERDQLKTSLPLELELAKANLASAESQFDYADTNYKRLQRLQLNNGAISETEVEQARSQFLATQQSVIGSRAEVERLESTTDLQIAQAESRVETAHQEALRLKDLRSQYIIRAPFEGVVTQKMTEVGQWVSGGSPVIELVDLDPIELVINIPQEYSGRLQDSIIQSRKTGKALKVATQFAGINGQFQGTVVRVIPQADLRSRSFPVRIQIANPLMQETYQLKPGMLGRAQLSIGRESEMILVSKDALVLGTNQNKIFKVIRGPEKMTVVPVVIETGIEIGSWVQVTGDLREGDEVVVIGNERLKPGAEVIVTETRKTPIDE
ncbi:MAG: efflux RND transporter periplasmic adaptor subunit [Planctomycetota bacterium]